MPDSSTSGFLIPGLDGLLYNQGGYGQGGYGTAPLQYDAGLDDILQQVIVGCTGLDGSLVRPRWQPVVPKQPEPTVNWCAIGIVSVTPDATPAIIHSGEGDGSDTLYRHEQIDVLASFYGPQGQQYAAMARDGMGLPQNNAMLFTVRMSFVATDAIRQAPELVNQQWIRRYDLTATFRRQVVRFYPVLNLLSAEVDLITDTVPPLTEIVKVSQS